MRHPARSSSPDASVVLASSTPPARAMRERHRPSFCIALLAWFVVAATSSAVRAQPVPSTGGSSGPPSLATSAPTPAVARPVLAVPPVTFAPGTNGTGRTLAFGKLLADLHHFASKRHVVNRTAFLAAPPATTAVTAGLANETSRLAAAGIKPSDPNFEARSVAFLQQADAARIARFNRSFAPIAPRIVRLPARFATRMATERSVEQRLIAQKTPLAVDRFGAIAARAVVRTGSGLRPGPIATSLGNVAAVAPVAPSTNATPESAPPAIGAVRAGDQILDASSVIAAGDELLISGVGFGTTPPDVRLSLPSCAGTPAMTVVYSGDDYIVVRVPEAHMNPDNAPDWTVSGTIFVNVAGQQSNKVAVTYGVPLQIVEGFVEVGPEKVADGGHATSDGGLGLVEGTTMLTSTGDRRESCCYNFGHGGDNVDTFMPRVRTINGYRVADTSVGPVDCTGDGNIYAGCDAGFLEDPLAGLSSGVMDAEDAGTDPFAALPDGGGVRSPETVVLWKYAAGHILDYVVGWTFVGPAGYRPLGTMPPVHGAVCQQ